MLVKLLSCFLVLPLSIVLMLPCWSNQTTYGGSIASASTRQRLASEIGPPGAVLTQHNDAARSGANLSETLLNTNNVNPVQFGKLFSRVVDGCLYAQPLYVPNVTIPQQGVHNVLYLATEHNSVYAYDADDPAAITPLWRVNLGASVPSTDISPTYNDLTPEIGITGTPVIDPSTGTLYVVAKTREDGGYHQRLHALDITTGSESFNGPAEISATFAGSGDGNVEGNIGFDPLKQLNRPGLLLQNGIVYVAFGSHGDADPYHGWVMGYQAATLQQVAVYNTTPDGGRGAIWMSGQGISGDSVNVYVTTGNGTCDADVDCGRNLGESFIKLTAALTPADWFTPGNRGEMDQEDLDVGSGGLLLIPGTSFATAAGKDGILRLVDTNAMGRFNADMNQDVQEFKATANKLLGAPIFWAGVNNDALIYLWGDGDSLKSFRLANGQFWTTPASQSSIQTPAGTSNSAPLSLSANGSEAGSGIVWAACPDGGDANLGMVQGILRAFDASDLSIELWDSRMDPTHDDAGLFAKFCPPTVANGKVYLASFSGQLNVYGLKSSVCSVSISASTMSVPSGGGSESVDVTAAADCVWSAITNADFISIDSDGPGSGAGTVQFSVLPNTGPARTGMISIGGQVLTITQDGVCSSSISPGGASFRKNGGSGAISVAADSTCAWTASPNVDWITIDSGGSGAGSGKISYSVTRSKVSRTGTITIGANVFTVNQTGKK